MGVCVCDLPVRAFFIATFFTPQTLVVRMFLSARPGFPSCHRLAVPSRAYPGDANNRSWTPGMQ